MLSGRMALLITLFLVLVNIFNNVTTNSPKVGGFVWCQVLKNFYILGRDSHSHRDMDARLHSLRLWWDIKTFCNLQNLNDHISLSQLAHNDCAMPYPDFVITFPLIPFESLKQYLVSFSFIGRDKIN